MKRSTTVPIVALGVVLILMVLCLAGCGGFEEREQGYTCTILGPEYALEVPNSVVRLQTDYQGYMEIVAIFPDTIITTTSGASVPYTALVKGSTVQVRHSAIAIVEQPSVFAGQPGWTYVLVTATGVTIL